AEFGLETEWTDAVASLRPLLREDSSGAAAWKDATTQLWSRPTTLVLHASSTRIGAIDLESKFTEAALGNLQLADYRNFAHGRHHWLAKRGETSGVLALVTDDDRSLAERTLALIPPEIPRAQLCFAGNASATALSALVAALRVSGWAGAARGIDPGRPGVPDFGRKLYNLPLPRAVRAESLAALTARDAAAIARKAGVAPERMAGAGELDRWRLALDSFRDRLRAATFAGVVLDYDGTIVDTRDRFVPASEVMCRQLERVAANGAWVAIATGRGRSVRRDLQARLPKTLWERVLVGYYNGAEIARLNDDDVPDGSDGTCSALAPLAAALRNQPELAQVARQTERRYQITLEVTRAIPESRLWDLAQQIIMMTGTADVTVTRSSHSVDIVAAGVSKLNVLIHLRNLTGSAPLLSIGDRGRWPGNDYELLRGPYALSVDEISVDPATCWNLAQPGQRGPAAALEYLSSLQVHDGILGFAKDALA
ncbi:sucrose-6-phosphate hydrolase, partial [Rhodopseudomonas palustris]|nr:sucrose-6-phosphate hydrolase [Rhodopseudomonas palustris]